MSLEVLVDEVLEAVGAAIIQRANIAVCAVDGGRAWKLGHDQSAVQCVDKCDQSAHAPYPVPYE